LYRAGLFKSTSPGVPVIVVGNLTAGGTGKTPTTIWLATSLAAHGFRPGIVSRGYGGSQSGSPLRVDAASDPAIVGDEPVLLAKRSGCPVAVDRDRVRAAAMLIEEGVDLIIADDGLQHLRLKRDYEICVVDGRRWFGNRFVLPAGPLREPASRASDVDQILVNGRSERSCETATEQNAIRFELVATEAERLNGSLVRPLERFEGATVHAVAAIGNPARFFDLLKRHGIEVIEHAHPDHARLTARDLEFDDDVDVFVTEKGAVKIGSDVPDAIWSVPVALDIESALGGPWLEQIVARMRARQEGT
jgi:tetraacyldisaccharide 4'-kinase